MIFKGPSRPYGPDPSFLCGIPSRQAWERRKKAFPKRESAGTLFLSLSSQNPAQLLRGLSQAWHSAGNALPVGFGG